VGFHFAQFGGLVGKIFTGNHGFSHEIWGFPANLSLQVLPTEVLGRRKKPARFHRSGHRFCRCGGKGRAQEGQSRRRGEGVSNGDGSSVPSGDGSRDFSPT